VKLELGKYYRTRDGRKAGPLSSNYATKHYPYTALVDDGSTVLEAVNLLLYQIDEWISE
jgi:hypothetical protein